MASQQPCLSGHLLKRRHGRGEQFCLVADGRSGDSAAQQGALRGSTVQPLHDRGKAPVYVQQEDERLRSTREGMVSGCTTEIFLNLV